jgi:hypothetical protein
VEKSPPFKTHEAWGTLKFKFWEIQLQRLVHLPAGWPNCLWTEGFIQLFKKQHEFLANLANCGNTLGADFSRTN